MWFVAGDVLVNSDTIVNALVTADNQLELLYVNGMVTHIQFTDYGSALTVLKTLVAELKVNIDLGGELHLCEGEVLSNEEV